MNKIWKIYDFFIWEGYIIKGWGFKGLGLEVRILECGGLKDSVGGYFGEFCFLVEFLLWKEGKG